MGCLPRFERAIYVRTKTSGSLFADQALNEHGSGIGSIDE